MKKNLYKIRLIIITAIMILTLTAFYGLFYPVEFLNTELTPLLQKIFTDISVISICFLIGMILITLITGNLYCSILCPFGILREFVTLIKGFFSKKRVSNPGNYGIKYLIAGLSFGALAAGSTIIIKYFDPYTIFGSTATLSIFGLSVTTATIILIITKKGFFCANICPVGAIWGLISKFSLNGIYINADKCVSCGMCNGSCPTGCIDTKAKTVSNENCVACMKCLSVCQNDAITYGRQKVSFNPTRRAMLLGIGSFAFLAAGYAAGYAAVVNSAKSTVKKISELILPPGAKNAKNMINKCLNCNLCINNCPSKILVKANSDFGAVHIDYSKGKGFCDFNCNKCGEVCPAGAISKLSLERKQKTKIATATVTDKCIGCGICSGLCPVNAIDWDPGKKAIINKSKCTGCGKCAASCGPNAIKITEIKEQIS